MPSGDCAGSQTWGHLAVSNSKPVLVPDAGGTVTPQWFHEFYVEHFGSGRTDKEVFPTVYKFNDKRAIRKQLEACGFRCELEYRSVVPGYLRFSRLSFLLGVLYERTTEKRFPPLRGVIIGLARKKPKADPSLCSG